MLDTVVYQ